MKHENNIPLVPLSDLVVSIKTGLNPRNNFQLNVDEAVCYYINVKSMQSGIIQSLSRFERNPILENSDRITENAQKMIQKKTNIEKNDVLISSILTDYIRAIAIEEDATYFGISENIYVIKLNDKVDSKYFAHILRTEEVKEQMEQKIGNRVLKRISKNDLLDIEIPVPDIKTQEGIVAVAECLQKTRSMLKFVNDTSLCVEHNLNTDHLLTNPPHEIMEDLSNEEKGMLWRAMQLKRGTEELSAVFEEFIKNRINK